jgi:cobalt-zinc-cadmium efflux system outer membrane protein
VSPEQRLSANCPFFLIVSCVRIAATDEDDVDGFASDKRTMRGLFFLILAAAVGCRAYPLDSPQAAEKQAAVSPREPAASEILPCSARVPGDQPATAADPPPASENPPNLPPPKKVEAPIDSAVTPPLADGQPITLDQLERMALTNNPTIPQAGALVQQEQGLARQAGLYPNPQAGYLRTDADQSGQSQTDGVFLSQEIVTAGKLRLARSAIRQDVQIRRWQLNAQQIRVLNDLRIRFYEVLGAQQAVELARELVTLAEDGVQAAEQLLNAKRGTRPDVLQAKIQLSAVHTALQEAEYRHRSAWQHMANIIGAPDLPPTPLAGTLENGIPDLDWKTSLEQLLTSSPLLKAQESEIRASETEVRLARAQAIPNVNVQVVAQRDHVLKYSSVSTLIAMPVPLFNRNQGNIVNAQGILRQQQMEYERIRLALSDALAASFRQYQTLRAQADRLGKEILPAAKENLELTTRGYKAGQMDFLHVQSARQTYFQSSMARIDALTELHKVVTEIQGMQLTGGLNPTEVGTALQTTPGTTTGIRGVILQQLQQQSATGSRNLPGAVQGAER